MIIVSQNKKVILNFDNIINLELEEQIKNMDREREIQVQAITDCGNYCVLAYYKTEERAKEVLQEIIQSCRDYRTAECDGYTDVLQRTAVYEMPEE